MWNSIFYSPTAKNLYKIKDCSIIDGNNQNIFIKDRLGEFISIEEQRHLCILKQLKYINEFIYKYPMIYQEQQKENDLVKQLMYRFQSTQETVLERLQMLNKEVYNISDNQNLVLDNMEADFYEKITFYKELIEVRNMMDTIIQNQHNALEEIRTQLEQYDETQDTAHSTVLEHMEIAQDKLLSKQTEVTSMMSDNFSETQKIIESYQENVKSEFNDIGFEILDELAIQTRTNNEVNSQNDEKYQELINMIVQLKDLYEMDKSSNYYFSLGDRITITNRQGETSSGVYVQSTENDILWVNDLSNRLCISNKKGLTISKE